MHSILAAKSLGCAAALSAAAVQAVGAIRYHMRSARPARAHLDGALRVLFLSRDLPFHGGVPRCLLYLARGSDRSRIDFRVASFHTPSPRMVETFAQLGITAHCIGDRGYLGPAGKLRRLALAGGVDVIVATTFKAYLCAKIAARRRDIRVIFWLHAIRGTVEGPLRRQILSLVCRTDPMLFVSEAVRRAQRPPNHRGPEAVIYNGVEDVPGDPEHHPYGREMCAALGVPPDSLILAYIAEFIGWKDHATAIAAIHQLAARGVEAHLLLIGTGKGFDAARALAAQGPAARRIHFLGPRSDARRILGLVDIYIHPSRGEGFGLAVVEAMLAGCPIIASRDGALVEYITRRQNGLLFTPGDAKDLADAIVCLAGDRQEAARIGRAARQFCLAKFSIEAFADSVARFIEESHPEAARRRSRAQSLAATEETQLLEPQTTGGRG